MIPNRIQNLVHKKISTCGGETGTSLSYFPSLSSSDAPSSSSPPLVVAHHWELLPPNYRATRPCFIIHDKTEEEEGFLKWILKGSEEPMNERFAQAEEGQVVKTSVGEQTRRLRQERARERTHELQTRSRTGSHQSPRLE